MDSQSQHRIRVLVVDDEGIWRDMLCDLLDPSLCDITSADCYNQAVQILRESAFLVVVTDQRLVDADQENIQGIQLLDEIEKLGDGTEVIVVTGYPRIDFARKAFLRQGHRAYDYLLKRPEGGGPFNTRQYRQLVKEAAEAARCERQKIGLQPFSASTHDFSPSRVTKALSWENATPPVSVDDVNRVLGRLLNSLQPLFPQMGRVWLLQPRHACELLCWSREYGKAALIVLHAARSRPRDRRRDWMQAGWRLAQIEEFSSDPAAGVSCFVEGMSFDEFETVVVME